MKLLLLVVCGVTLFWRNAETAEVQDANDVAELAKIVKSLLVRLNELEAKSQDQANEIARQAQQIDLQAHENRQQDQEKERLAQENLHQTQEIERLKYEAVQSEQKRSKTKADRTSEKSDVEKTSPLEPDTRSQFTGYACTDSTMNLVCPGNKTILLSNGNYGQFHNRICSAACCPPNPLYDCTEDIEDNRVSDWIALQVLCDGKTSCQFETPGSGIDNCESNYLSDYMQVFYSCLPDDETGPVAFTASAETGTGTEYPQQSVIVFNEVITNFGGHYNPTTSSFICPIDGVYQLTVHVQGYAGYNMYVYLHRDGELLVSIWMDDISGFFARGSTSAIIECSRGQEMWVNLSNGGSIYASGGHTLFAGHLIHRL